VSKRDLQRDLQKENFNRGMRFGALVEALCIARKALESVGKYRDLMSKDDAQRMRECYDTLIGLEQRAWNAADEETK
jgi:hypothetical protein